MDAAFDLARGQHSRREICSNAIRLELRSHALRRYAAIDRRHQPNFRVSKMLKHMLQVISRYADITIVHHYKVITRVAQHLDQVADFAVRAQQLRTNHQTDLVLRKLRHELPDQRDGLILDAVYA